MQIRLMSFNTQHCLDYRNRVIDIRLMADTIQTLGGEIIGLQEMCDEGVSEAYTAQTKALSEYTGYPYHYFAKAIDFGGKDPYGNALLSKYPIRFAQTILIPDPPPERRERRWETRCILKAVIDAGFPLTVLVSHFGLSDEEKRNAIAAVLEQLEPEKCVLMGDFNMMPEDERLQPIREKMLDTQTLFDAPKLSFPSDSPTRKIDYIFTSRDLAVTAADIPAVVASDHRPCICDIAVGKETL